MIDFGNCCVGDPACDLVIAWTLLAEESRIAFRSELNLDSQTWVRARGWALWKALITLADLEDKFSDDAKKQTEIINLVIEDTRSEL